MGTVTVLDYAAPMVVRRHRRVWYAVAAIFACYELLFLLVVLIELTSGQKPSTRDAALPRVSPTVAVAMACENPPFMIDVAFWPATAAIGAIGALLAARGRQRAKTVLVIAVVMILIATAIHLASSWLLSAASPISYFDIKSGRLVGQVIHQWGVQTVLNTVAISFPAWLVLILLKRFSVTREVKALDDLERATGKRPHFTPYDR